MTSLMTSPFLWLFATSAFCPLFSQSISWNEESGEIPLDMYPCDVSSIWMFCPLSSHYAWINIWMKRTPTVIEMILICVLLSPSHMSVHTVVPPIFFLLLMQSETISVSTSKWRVKMQQAVKIQMRALQPEHVVWTSVDPVCRCLHHIQGLSAQYLSVILTWRQQHWGTDGTKLWFWGDFSSNCWLWLRVTEMADDLFSLGPAFRVCHVCFETWYSLWACLVFCQRNSMVLVGFTLRGTQVRGPCWLWNISKCQTKWTEHLCFLFSAAGQKTE